MTVRVWLAVYLGAVLVGLGMGWIWGRQAVERRETSALELSAGHHARVAELELEIRSLQSKVDERDLQIAALRRRLSQAWEEKSSPTVKAPESLRFTIPDAAGSGAAIDVDLTTIQQRMRDAMNSPEMKELLNSGRRLGVTRMVERRYAALFRALGLDPDEATRLQALLIERNLASTAGWLPFGEPSEVGITGEVAAMEEDIQAMLGPGGYETYRRYEESIEARQEVGWFERRLSDGAVPLSDGQRDGLVELFHEFGGPPDDAGKVWMRAMMGNPSPGSDVSSLVDESLDEIQLRYQNILTGAEQILDEGQMRTLEGYLNEQIRHREMQAGIASRLFHPPDN
jgi:hypothetical protein